MSVCQRDLLNVCAACMCLLQLGREEDKEERKGEEKREEGRRGEGVMLSVSPLPPQHG